MRLDELHGAILEAFENGLPADCPVTVILDGVNYDYPIDRVEPHADGVRIYLEL